MCRGPLPLLWSSVEYLEIRARPTQAMATALSLAWDLCGVDFDHASPPPRSKPNDAYLSCRPLPPFVVNRKMHTCLAVLLLAGGGSAQKSVKLQRERRDVTRYVNPSSDHLRCGVCIIKGKASSLSTALCSRFRIAIHPNCQDGSRQPHSILVHTHYSKPHP